MSVQVNKAIIYEYMKMYFTFGSCSRYRQIYCQGLADRVLTTTGSDVIDASFAVE